MSRRAKTASDTLKETGDLLRERGWVAGRLGENIQGVRLDTTDSADYHRPLGFDERRRLEGAARFCAVGALKVADGPREADAARVLAEVIRSDWVTLPSWEPTSSDDYHAIYRCNDNQGQEVILQAIDAAYTLALQEEGLEPEDVL